MNMIPEQPEIKDRVAAPCEPGDATDTGRNSGKHRVRFWLWLILGSYLLVTLGYGFINPLFEAPDEHLHFFTIQQIVDTGHLPTVAPGEDYDRWVGQEAAQPPLYYLLGTALAAPFNSANPREILWLNKFVAMGNASSLNNINRFIHGPDESFPWHGYALVMHLLRGFSTLLGFGTLLFIYGSGRLLWPNDTYPVLLATSLVAFLPQYSFLHSSVTNDALIIFLVSAALWQLVRLWLDLVTRSRLLLLGVTIGLAALAKNAGIILLVYALAVLFLLVLRGEPGQEEGIPPSSRKSESNSHGLTGLRLIGSIVLYLILPVILISGWLWARNWILYGDFTATNQFIRLAGGDRNYRDASDTAVTGRAGGA